MRRQKDGRTLREHYEQVLESTGKCPELDGPDLPEIAEHVFRWFLELNSARGSSGFGAGVIGYLEIDAWARLTGRRPQPWEVGCLRELDMLFLEIHMPAPSRPGSKPEKGAPR